VDEINDWISKATEGQIDKMLSEIDMDMLAYIISALYFKVHGRKSLILRKRLVCLLHLRTAALTML